MAPLTNEDKILTKTDQIKILWIIQRGVVATDGVLSQNLTLTS